MATRFEIHPTIGVGRLGDSEGSFYLAPDRIGGPPLECDARESLNGRRPGAAGRVVQGCGLRSTPSGGSVPRARLRRRRSGRRGPRGDDPRSCH
jgi:hypothetical protein